MTQSLMYLFAAFAVVWLGIFAYLVYLSSRLTALQQQFDALSREQGARNEEQETP